MNKTTVKRGIGAVLLALLAAGLLAFLLKDKADQRQDIVDMPLPGTDSTNQAADGTTKLPQLSMDNTTSALNADGSVIASAGAKGVADATEGVLDSATGTIAASATAVGAGVAGAVGAVTSAGEKALDFNVRPPINNSGDFRDLSDVDLVNNGAGTTANSTEKATSTSASASAKPTPVSTPRPSNTTKGSVIASSSASGAGSQARLIDERKTTPPRSSRTDRVITSKKPSTSSSSKPAAVVKTVATPKPPATSTTGTSRTGYAIQLLATSSASRAQSLVGVMTKEGYDAYSTKVTQNGKLLYRVRIGRYASKAEASKIHQSMKRRYKKNADVNRSAIVSR